MGGRRPRTGLLRQFFPMLMPMPIKSFFYLKHSPNFVKVFTREGLSNLWNELVKDGELTAVNNR